VIREEAGARVLDAMNWGFPFNGKPVTTLSDYTSPFWKLALTNPGRRCLVPVTEFQEWPAEPLRETGKEKAFWFKVPSQPIFALAGIWWPSADVPVFSLLTTGYDGAPSTHVVGAIHPKACPVILHPEDYDRWLHTDLDDALTLAAAYPSQLMRVRS
jgi:putative SOS response-associated peptidase YedK